jgi:hypothetical protein
MERCEILNSSTLLFTTIEGDSFTRDATETYIQACEYVSQKQVGRLQSKVHDSHEKVLTSSLAHQDIQNQIELEKQWIYVYLIGISVHAGTAIMLLF